MKKYRTAVIVAICILIAAATGFAASGNEQTTIKSLISQRTDILNDFYNGKIQKKAATEMLTSMETDLLLAEDLKNLDLYFQTDIDQVQEYSFEKINIKQADKSLICADVTMLWKVEGLDGKDSFLHTYSVICEKEGKTYKLAQFY